MGEAKSERWVGAGGEVRVIAPRAHPAVMDWAGAGLIAWEPRAFVPNALEGIFLVIAATASAELNQQIFNQAQHPNILCNAVDDPENCDFYFPSLMRHA